MLAVHSSQPEPITSKLTAVLKAIIIEDERPAMELLLQALHEVDDTIQVEAMLSSVKESIQYLSTRPEADIIFSDVQLTDGHSFEIFKNVRVKIPVIFITGYDEFMLNAFACNGIDYLLKPITKKELQLALYKYRMLEKHFTTHNEPINNLIRHIDNRKRNRIIVRKGLEHIALKLEDVVLFYTENKLVYVIDRFGKKFIAEQHLSELEEQLDASVFFRANRQYLININFIKGFKSYDKVKLKVDILLAEMEYDIIISQENAGAFREWMNG